MSLLNADGRKMRYNNLGGTGLMVSEISFGSAFEFCSASCLRGIPVQARALCLLQP